MARVRKIWEHKAHRFVHGHIVLFAAICSRDERPSSNATTAACA